MRRRPPGALRTLSLDPSDAGVVLVKGLLA